MPESKPKRSRDWLPRRLWSSTPFILGLALGYAALPSLVEGVRPHLGGENRHAREQAAKTFKYVAVRRVQGEPLRISNPANTVLVIFNHGSTGEGRPDSCSQKYPPLVVSALHGRRIDGKPIQVYSYCTPSKTGEYSGSDRSGEPKILKRTRDIENLVRHAAVMGVPPKQIFLIGQSAGGWASLLVARRGAVKIGGLVAFAPAFAGKWRGRPAGWWLLHNRLAAEIGEAARIDGLVYSFRGGAWSPPKELRFLKQVPGIDLVALGPDSIDAIPCYASRPHFLAYEPCFRDTQLNRILEFMASRLRAGA